MYILESEITIGGFRFRSVYDVEITKSVDQISDTATVKMPNRFRVKDNGQWKDTETAIKVGDPVVIKLGYLSVYFDVEFTGFVRKIKPTTPLEIECEDAIWALRRRNINKAWNTGTTLKEVLQEIVSGSDIVLSPHLPEMKIDKYILKDTNGAQALQAIKQNFAMSVFIDSNGLLYCGLQQADNIDKQVVYDLNYNIVGNELEYTEATDRRIKVRYTYLGKDNKRVEVEVGDDDGELRSFNTSVVSDPDKLREMAQAEISKLKYDGYDGSITSFLVPVATRGMSAKLIDQEHPQREGVYFIRKVTTSFNTSGARRKVELGEKL